VASIRLEGIRKIYPNGQVALRHLDLAVADGELLVVVGPSGCGKSTALRVVAGLEAPSDGRVLLGERDVTDASPRQRDVAMVFQNYALYPHKSVRENLGFGLRMRAVAADEIQRRTRQAAERLHIADVLDRRPAELSGGQRQRVALGRALVREPQAFLFDEPLSNLDARLRVETRTELARLHRELGATMLYVTHDQEEAMTLGDRIAVLCDGALEQLGAPLEVYRRPATRFVADFIGVPRINWFAGRAVREDGSPRIRCDDFRVEAPAGLAAEEGRELALGIRPQDLEPTASADAEIAGRVELIEPLGSALLVHARSESGVGFRVLAPPDGQVAIGARIAARPRPDCLHVFDAHSGARLV
jgi:multiple sugar transport system ATP-binding protein